jgi:hypothetical protein
MAIDPTNAASASGPSRDSINPRGLDRDGGGDGQIGVIVEHRRATLVVGGRGVGRSEQ